MRNKLFAALALILLGALNSQVFTARAQSPFGNAISLDGTDQYVSVPTAAGSAVNSPFTIEAWVYLRAYATCSRLMDFSSGAAVNDIACVLSSGMSGQPALYFFNGSSTIIGRLTSTTRRPPTFPCASIA
jgi:hypothetical protein